ncbi:MAG TPA: PEGA domain-containing protein [Kofleriaceae bacterium]
MAGGPDRIPVTTNPPGATVFVDNMPVGQTPTMITLDRGRNSGIIRIELPGFAPVMIARDKTINGWFWVNIVLLSPLGVIIDLVTGNVNAFDDTPIVLGLTPANGGPPPQGYAPQPGYAPPPPGYAPPPQPYPPQPPPPPRR